jgi:2'-hydroxyisoflavone reductase
VVRRGWPKAPNVRPNVDMDLRRPESRAYSGRRPIPTEHANQIIDQRDLTEWIVRLAEDGTTGDFNATGLGERLSMGSMLEQIGTAVGSPHELTRVPEAFLEAQGVSLWTDPTGLGSRRPALLCRRAGCCRRRSDVQVGRRDGS